MAAPLLRTDYLFLRELLRSRVGHELGEGKEYLVESRLGLLVESNGLPGIPVLFDRLRARDRVLEAAALEAMMTCETSFFRSGSTFESLRQMVIPELIRARVAQRKLRIWCAGCSTGQEPYSVAMTLADHFPELALWDVSILATDLSEQALRQAKEGSYSFSEVRRGLSEATLKKHFVGRGERWMVGPVLRRLVVFRTLNLAEPIPHHDEFDLILLRNVLIYFCPEFKPPILAAIRRAIKDDGYLFLGESETILGLGDEFTFPTGDLEYYRPAVHD